MKKSSFSKDLREVKDTPCCKKIFPLLKNHPFIKTLSDFWPFPNPGSSLAKQVISRRCTWQSLPSGVLPLGNPKP